MYIYMYMHAVDDLHHTLASASYLFAIVVKKRKRPVEKATKQKSVDGKPPKKKQKRDDT